MFSRNHSSTLIVRKTRMRTRFAVIAIAFQLLAGVKAEVIKSNEVDPQSGGQRNHLEVRIETKASPVQELLKKLLIAFFNWVEHNNSSE